MLFHGNMWIKDAMSIYMETFHHLVLDQHLDQHPSCHNGTGFCVSNINKLVPASADANYPSISFWSFEFRPNFPTLVYKISINLFIIWAALKRPFKIQTRILHLYGIKN